MGRVAQNIAADKEETKRRRGHHEGTITEQRGKKDTTYRAQILVGTNRLGKTFPTKIEAQKWIRQTLSKADEHMLPADGGKKPLIAFLDEWLANVRTSVKPKAYEHYDWAVRLHLKPAFEKIDKGRLKLADLRADHLQNLYTEKLAAGLAPRSVHHLHRVIHNALGDAFDKGLVPHNVADKVKAPKVPKAEHHVWTPEQARTFVTSIANERLEAAFVLAIACGMRVGEISGLKWEDIDLDAGTLRVRRTRQRLRKLTGETEGPTTYVADGAPKTQKGARLIVLPAPALAALRRWRTTQKEERLIAGERWQQTGYAITFQKGTPMTPNELHHQFVKLVARLDLPRIRPHDLRHTCATVLLSQNVPAKYVQELLGHSQIAVTMDLYSAFLPPMAETTARAMERVLGGQAVAG